MWLQRQPKKAHVTPEGKSNVLHMQRNKMQKKITMPAHLMYDGKDPRLFEHFSAVAQRMGVYTANDYADILEFLIGRWRSTSANSSSCMHICMCDVENWSTRSTAKCSLVMVLHQPPLDQILIYQLNGHCFISCMHQR